MKLISFDIELDNPTNAYYAGETVRGNVNINLSDEVTGEETGVIIAMLTMKARGKAYTYWHTGVEETRRKFGQKEKYFDQQLPLYRKGTEKVEIRMQPGERSYLFRFTLPWEIPSTFEETKGSVEYYIKAYIKGLEKEDIKIKKVFNVTGIVDLNISTDALQPADLRAEKNIGCFCCQSGPVGFEMKLPRTRFVPEESIQFDVEFFNMSKRIVSEVVIAILQISTFKAIEMRPRKTAWVVKKSEKIIDTMEIPPLNPGDMETFERRSLKIGVVPPTKLAGCNLIDVDYFIQVKMKIPYALPLEGKVPIFIGTIPLRNDKLSNDLDNENGNCESTTQLDTELEISNSADYMPLNNGSKNSESVAPSEAAATSQQDDETGSLDDETRNSESAPLVDVPLPNNVPVNLNIKGK